MNMQADWNNNAVEACTKDGKNAPSMDKYSASKVLAEKWAWNFVEENKANIGFDVVTIIPPWVRRA